MRIITNNVPRELSGFELTGCRARRFSDYLDRGGTKEDQIRRPSSGTRATCTTWANLWASGTCRDSLLKWFGYHNDSYFGNRHQDH